eukprot:scaffold2123_cov111-Isochrysis_galbana.AAC.6
MVLLAQPARHGIPHLRRLVRVAIRRMTGSSLECGADGVAARQVHVREPELERALGRLAVQGGCHPVLDREHRRPIDRSVKAGGDPPQAAGTKPA